MTGCHGAATSCERAAQGAHFFPPPVQLRLVQTGTSPSGFLSIGAINDTAVLGSVIADGEFVITGNRQDWRVGGTFAPMNERQLAVTINTEKLSGERLVLTFRYEGSVARQQ